MELPETERAPVLGERPALAWVRPTDLLVDATYQRDLSPSSVRLIRSIVREFAWSRIKPPVVVRANGGGEMHVVDGQHTAIAAASLGLDALPVFVVDAPDVLERARAFVSHNQNRLMVTALDIHRSLVAAGDPLSRTVQKVCDEVGVRLCVVSRQCRVDVGDTRSIDRIRRLFTRQGAEHARKVLSCLVRAKCAPIAEMHLTAAGVLVLEGAGVERLAAAVRVGGDDDLAAAKARAGRDRVPNWKPLAAIWRRRMEAGR